MNMRENPKPQEIYKHFKGNNYQIITLAKHTETGETLVIYQALYGDFQIYARELSMFLSETDYEKYPQAAQKYRFEKAEAITETTGEAAADEEFSIDPLVMEFLEAGGYEERLNILAALHHRITDEMINTMAAAADIEIDNGDIEERYTALRNCMLTLEKYECNRLR